MKSKYVIKYDKILKKYKNMKNFSKKIWEIMKISENLSQNRKIEKSMKIKKLIKKRRGQQEGPISDRCCQ